MSERQRLKFLAQHIEERLLVDKPVSSWEELSRIAVSLVYHGRTDRKLGIATDTPDLFQRDPHALLAYMLANQEAMRHYLREERGIRLIERDGRFRGEFRCIECGSSQDQDFPPRCYPCEKKRRGWPDEESRCLGCGYEIDYGYWCDDCEERKAKRRRQMEELQLGDVLREIEEGD